METTNLSCWITGFSAGRSIHANFDLTAAVLQPALCSTIPFHVLIGHQEPNLR